MEGILGVYTFTCTHGTHFTVDGVSNIGERACKLLSLSEGLCYLNCFVVIQSEQTWNPIKCLHHKDFGNEPKSRSQGFWSFFLFVCLFSNVSGPSPFLSFLFLTACSHLVRVPQGVPFTPDILPKGHVLASCMDKCQQAKKQVDNR